MARRPLTTGEQLLRWLGLPAFVLGLLLGGVNSQAAQSGDQSTALGVLALVLILAGIGCYIALGVLAYQYRQRHDSTGAGAGSEDSRNMTTPR